VCRFRLRPALRSPGGIVRRSDGHARACRLWPRSRGRPPMVTYHEAQLHRGETSHMTEQSGTGPYADEEWENASQRVRAIREQATANPVAADAEARRYAEIANRVQTLRAIREARWADPAADVGATGHQSGGGLPDGTAEQPPPRYLGPLHQGYRRETSDNRWLRRPGDRDQHRRHPPRRPPPGTTARVEPGLR